MDFADALHLALATGVERFLTFDQRFIKTANAQGLPVHSV
jgi:predicted nucleic acid-binding protein